MKAAIYIRVSKTSQHIDRQVAELTSFAAANNFEIAEIYEDQISGFKSEMDREGLKKLMEDAKTDKFDIILFSELSRLSRKTTKILELISYFRDEQKKEVFFQKQNIWIKKEKQDLGSEITLNVLSTISSYEIELQAERVAGGKIAGAKKGNWVWGNYPYGYSVVKKKLVINEDESLIIKEIFNLYENGYTAVQIANLFNNKHYPTISERKKVNINSVNGWIPSVVSKLLREKSYIGEFKKDFYEPQPTNKINSKQRTNKVLIETVEIVDKSIAIIDDELFYSVQDKIKKNNKCKDTAKKHTTLLKQLLTCGECGSHFMIKTNKDKKYNYNFDYYICSSYIPNFKTKEKKCSDIPSITTFKVDGIVVDCAKTKLMMLQKSENNKNIESELINSLGLKNDLFHSNIITLNNLETEFNNLVKKSIKYNIADEIIDEEYAKKESEKNNILNQNIKLNNEIKAISKRLKSINNISDISLNEEEFNNLSHFELKELLNKYIDRVELHKVDKWFLIKIVYVNGDEDYCIVRKTRSLQTELYKKYQEEHLSQIDYDFLLKTNSFDNMENTYLFYHHDNSNRDVQYDKSNKTFIVADIEYNVEEYIKHLTEQADYTAEFYKYFYYSE